jgi:hypothetical protein
MTMSRRGEEVFRADLCFRCQMMTRMDRPMAAMAFLLEALFQGTTAKARRGLHDRLVATDGDTLGTALAVRGDDLLKEPPKLARGGSGPAYAWG